MSHTKIGRVKKRRNRRVSPYKIAIILKKKPKIGFPKFRITNKKKLLFKFVLVVFIVIGINTSFVKVKNEVDRFRTEAFAMGYFNFEKNPEVRIIGAQQNYQEIYNPSSKLANSFSTTDIRIYVLEEYFRANNSPLAGTAKLFVEACDKYGAPSDCIGIVAIAKHETDLCKYYTSAQMYNCWGWGGAGVNRIRFESFEQSIDVVTSQTMKYYGAPFLTDFRNGQDFFCGRQDECIGWGDRVNRIARQIDDFSEGLGVGRLTNLR